MKEMVAWAEGRDVPVRVTTIHVPLIEVRSVRRKLRLSQSEFAAKFGFAAPNASQLGSKDDRGPTGRRACCLRCWLRIQRRWKIPS
jgi:hypothetical protein